MPKRKLPIGLDDIKLVLELAQEGLKGVGVPGVEAITALPLKLIEYCETIAENNDELNELVQTLEALQRIVLQPLGEALERGHQYVPNLKQRLHRLTQTFADMEHKLGSFKNLTRWQALRRREDISDLLRQVNRDIGRAVSQFKLGGQITVEMQIWNLAAQNLMKTLGLNAKARFDASEKQACLSNTRSVLLDTLLENLHCSPHTFVCLHGSPGTGKSAVAKTIAASLHRDGSLAASYFFDKRRSDARNFSLSTFVSTLVYQLARFSYDFHAALSLQLEKDPLLANATAEVRLQELLIEPLRSLSPNAPGQRWIIVIDALDESGDGDQQQRLMNLLRECAEINERLVFFLTCRPEAGIMRVLRGRALGSRTVMESMDQQDSAGTARDISIFVTVRLAEIRLEDESSTTPTPDDIAHFTASCDNLFELAAIRLRQLAMRTRHEPFSQAFQALLEGPHHLTPTSSPLRDVYMNILAAAYDFGDDDAAIRDTMIQRHHRLVGALTALRHPLPIAALAALVGIGEPEARKALEPLSSVISVPRDDKPVHFYHASFLDYILSTADAHTGESPTNHPYLVDPIQCNDVLANRSLIIMNQLLRRNALDLNHHYTFNHEICELPRMLFEHIPEYLRYACLHWADHLRTGEVSNHESRSLLNVWCNEKIPFYFEVLSLLSEMDHVVAVLDYARTWARKMGGLDTALTLLDNALRMAQMFHPALLASASSIYSSALPLMPSCELRARYLDLVPEEPVLIRGRLSTWPAQLWAQSSGGWVSCVSLSRDGRRVASASTRGVCILSSITGTVEQVLKVRTQGIQTIAFSPDGTQIVGGAKNGSVYIWVVATGEEERLLARHHSCVNCVAFSPDGHHVVSASDNPSFRMWSVASGEQEHVFRGHGASVLSVAYSCDGAHIASGSLDHSIRIWSATTGEQEHVLAGHSSPVLSVAFSPDGEYITSGSHDCSVRAWSVTTGKQEQVFKGHNDSVFSVGFSPDSALIVSGSDDHTARIWSMSTGVQTNVLEGHSDCVSSVGFSVDGTYVVSGSSDGSVRAWSSGTNWQESVSSGPGHRDTVVSVAFSPDRVHIASGSDDTSVVVWSAVTGEQKHRLKRHSDSVNSVAFSPDGARIVSGSSDGSVRVWSTSMGKQEMKLQSRNSACPSQSVAFSTQGLFVKSVDSANQTSFWHSRSGVKLHPEFAPTMFFCDSEHETHKDGWVDFNGKTIWLPRYIRGQCWKGLNTLVVDSDDKPGSLAFISLSGSK